MTDENQMKPADFSEVLAICEESLTWDNETLERCPKVFLLVREIYQSSVKKGK